MASLRAWLRKNPQPFSLRIRTEDGEERTIKLGDGRDKWKVAEQTLAASRAVSVEAVAADGSVIRGEQLREETAASSGDDGADYDEKRAARTMLAQASMLDRYGDRLNQAFDKGASAANTGQENLVALVEVLTMHLSSAITSLHNVSINLANVVARAGGGEETTQHDTNGQMLTQLLGQVAMRQMGGGDDEKPKPKPQANGGKP